MRKSRCMYWIAIALTAAISVTACSKKAPEPEKTLPDTPPSTEAVETEVPESPANETAPEETEAPEGVVNPWTDCEDLAGAEQVAGFPLAFAEALNDEIYTAKVFRAMGTDMLEVVYESQEGAAVTVRQAPGAGQDISGDYNEYEKTWEQTLYAYDAILKGEEDSVKVCTFSAGEYSFAILPENGMSTDELEYILAMDFFSTGGEEEGAPVVENGRFIDEVALEDMEIAGEYSGIEYSHCYISIYTSPEEDSNEVGNMEIVGQDGQSKYYGNLIKVMDNMYEMYGEDVNVTVYTDNGTVNLELYIDGVHADYFVMTEHYES